MKIILSNRLYVPKEQVSRIDLDAWSYDLGSSEDFITIQTVQEMGDYYGFHRGNLNKIKEHWDLSGMEDQRKLVKFKEPVKFIGILKTEQKEILIKYLQKGPGVIQAPPRWGKTVWASALITMLKQKTLFLAHEISLLQQMEEEFRVWTNINDLEKKLGYKLIGILDDKIFPVLTLSTYQRFIRPKGQGWLYKHRDEWGLVGVDECHRVTADCYTEVTSRLNSYYRLGLTATPFQSKTELHCIEFDVLGPIVAEGIIEQLSVDIIEHRTNFMIGKYKEGIFKKGKFDHWADLQNQFMLDNDRNLEICKWAVKDVRDGHTILITTDRVQHTQKLKDILNKIAPEYTVVIISGQVTGKARKKLREKIKAGEINITIAMNRIVQLGWNIPVWSCFHNTLPTTNPENWYQRISRIRTPMKGKKKPLCRYYTALTAYIPAMISYRKTIQNNASKYKFSWLNYKKQKLPPDLEELTFEEIEKW